MVVAHVRRQGAAPAELTYAPAVRLAPSVDDFLTSPVGAEVRGRTFAAWMPTPKLVGASHFGGFDPADLPALQALFGIALHEALVAPYDVVHDLGGVDVLDRPAFDLLSAFLAEQMPKLAERVRRLAVVRPPGLPGAAFTGLFHDFGSKLDAKLFDARDAAFDWLAIEGAVRADLAAIAEHFEHAAPVLRRLRDLLAADPRLDVEGAAKALGHSPRSLQRHLAAEDTSFRDEVTSARVRAAKKRLVETDHKVEAIARELGFRSAAAFTTMFARAAGEPPLAFRQKRRGGGG